MLFSPGCCSVLHMWWGDPSWGQIDFTCTMFFQSFWNASVNVRENLIISFCVIEIAFPPNSIQPFPLTIFTVITNHLPISFSVCSIVLWFLSHTSPPSPSVPLSLSTVAEVEAPGRRLRLETWGRKKKSPSEDESAINLPLCHSFLHPLLLSFTIASYVSVLYHCLSILPVPVLSRPNPIFSQGRTCVMALLSPLCHPARTNINPLSALSLLLLCLDNISRRLRAIVFLSLTVLQWAPL